MTLQYAGAKAPGFAPTYALHVQPTQHNSHYSTRYRPNPTKRRIKHNIMICKIAIDIAAAATIECDDGEPPITRDGPPGCDIGGDAPARARNHT
ncbi:hypothetical protein EYC84_000660 [Monilinia fructicola]|uniref:Uncharacterized protein n=1 Tax=Monilinia fructicola TaxID=38448 RepID=A0A5M9JRT8_MONFR|nr:hypothetical protein EYC84_000660 [Monilinia fructicola]